MMTIPLWQRIKIIFNLQINQRGKHLINTNICILLCFLSIIYLWLFSCLLFMRLPIIQKPDKWDTQHTLPVTSTTNPFYVSPELGKNVQKNTEDQPAVWYSGDMVLPQYFSELSWKDDTSRAAASSPWARQPEERRQQHQHPEVSWRRAAPPRSESNIKWNG